MGETQNQPFQLSFDGPLKVGSQGPRAELDTGFNAGTKLDDHARKQSQCDVAPRSAVVVTSRMLKKSRLHLISHT